MAIRRLAVDHRRFGGILLPIDKGEDGDTDMFCDIPLAEPSPASFAFQVVTESVTVLQLFITH